MNVFRYKLDFSYQQTLLYLFTLVLYAGIRGSFVEGQFSFVFHDPLVYIIGFFFLVALGTLFLNIRRARTLTIEADRLIFHARHRERIITLDEIEWIHIGRERTVQTAGRFQLILLKTKRRRLAYRIRVGRYEHEKELVAAMEVFAEHLPKRASKRFSIRKKRQ
jgi:hypothetical protein